LSCQLAVEHLFTEVTKGARDGHTGAQRINPADAHTVFAQLFKMDLILKLKQNINQFA